MGSGLERLVESVKGSIKSGQRMGKVPSLEVTDLGALNRSRREMRQFRNDADYVALRDRLAEALRATIMWESSREYVRAVKRTSRDSDLGGLISGDALRRTKKRRRVAGFGRVSVVWADMVEEARDHPESFLAEVVHRAAELD